jgi:uncharacterized protein YfaA (DUF2138 family)
MAIPDQTQHSDQPDQSTPAQPAAVQSPSPLRAKAWTRKGSGLLVLLLVVLLVGVGAVVAWYRWHLPAKPDNQAQINLGTPDVWLHSQNLALLPHDLLQVPLLKSLLTEDFLYFYQQDVDWLSLQGALRRISFEHDLKWSDDLLKDVASAPTDVYLWRDGTHALRYWAVSIQRDYLLTLAQQLAQLKWASDKQVTEIGRITVDGDDVPLLKVTLSATRSMILVAHGSRLVLFSDSAMLSRDKGKLDPHADAFVQSLLAKDAAARGKLISGPQAPHMTVEQPQTIWMSNRFFALGYGALLPDVQALRFDYDGKVWSGKANTRHVAPDPQIWSQIPAYAALCNSTSVDWTQVASVLQSAKAPVEQLLKNKGLNSLSATGAVCWYAEKDDEVAQPLFVALRGDKPESIAPADMAALFNWGIGTNRDDEKAVRALQANQRSLSAQIKSGKDDLKALQEEADALNKADRKDMAQVDKDAEDKTAADNIKSKQHEIDDLLQKKDDLAKDIKDAQKAGEPERKAAQALTTRQQGGFTVLGRTKPIAPEQYANPTLAYDAHVIYFSPSPALIQRAMTVAQHSYPNVLEESKGLIDPNAITLLYSNPAKLAQLITHTGQAALPQKTAGRLRTAFDYHMPSRMTALAELPPFTVTVPNPTAVIGDGSRWESLVLHSAGQ